MYYVYILESFATKRLYKGFTENLKRRLEEHNQGLVPLTKPNVPHRLVYYAGFVNKTDALREERFLKTGKGKERIKLLLQETRTARSTKKPKEKVAA